MEISDERIKEFQDIFKRKYGKELSWAEATESVQNLVGLVELAHEHLEEERRRELKLKDHPKGFHLDDGGIYSCCICRRSISNEQTWWDKSGIKCLPCQGALEKRIIPKSVCKRDDSWYAIWEFEYYFGIKSPTIRKFIRQGKLKSRAVLGPEGKKYFELILIKDNAGVLPKKPKSHVVHEEGNKMHIEHEQVTLPDFMEEVRVKK